MKYQGMGWEKSVRHCEKERESVRDSLQLNKQIADDHDQEQKEIQV